METATATANPACFGDLYDALAPECQDCKAAEKCSAKAPVAPVAPVEDTITTELEEAAAEEAAEEEIIEIIAEEKEEALADAEKAAIEEIATPKVIVKAPKTPKAAGSREITSIKSATFKKAVSGKLVLADAAPFDLVVNAGDIIENINPKSKYFGMQFKVSCYSIKYECFRATAQDATKKSVDFAPREIKVIS